MMSLPRPPTGLFFTLVVVLAAFGSTPVRAEEPVTAIRTGKAEIKGTLKNIESDGTIQVDTGSGTERIPLADVVEVRFSRVRMADETDRTRLYLSNGDRLSGRLLRGTEDGNGLVFEDSALGEVEFADFGKIRWILFPPLTVPPDLPYMKEPGDVVFRGEEGSISGSLNGFGKDVLKIEKPEVKMALEIAYADIRAVYIAPLFRAKEPEGLLGVLTLRNGDILTGRIEGVTLGTIGMDLVSGVKVQVPLNVVAGLGVRNGNYVFLSDLTPRRIKEVPWLLDDPVVHTPPFDGKTVFNYRRDRSYKGGPLRLENRTYLKGIGTHSWTEIEYDLGGKYSAFESRIGLDDCANGQGSVVFKVLVDGKEMYKSPKVFGKDHPKRSEGVTEPLDVRVDVTGAKTLALVVDYTEPAPKDRALPLDDHVLDRADWVAARLVK